MALTTRHVVECVLAYDSRIAATTIQVNNHPQVHYFFQAERQQYSILEIAELASAVPK